MIYLEQSDKYVKEVCMRLRSLRAEAGIVQQTLADVLGVEQSTYSDYENGRTQISTPMLIKLADYYNTSVDYILGITDIRFPYID